MKVQYKLVAVLLTATWMNAGICAQHASTAPAAGNTPQSAAKKAVHAKKHGKRARVARAGKNSAARDGDAEVLAQVLASDNKNPLWGKPQQ
ncbi:signal peptide protein [Ralstonia sp. A12]|nr:signal peptide protein [Ralstonia sp. A12]